MQRCTCSTRALELFVQDVAGLALRPRQARAAFLPRRFSMQPLRRQLGSTAYAPIEDDAIPFVNLETVPSHAPSPQQTRATVAMRKDAVENEVEDGWHAEIELLPSQAANVVEGIRRDDDVQTIPQHAPTSGMDSVRLRDLHPATARAPTDAVPPRLIHHPQLGVGDAATAPRKESPSLAHVAARKARKLRRVEAGKFKPSNQIEAADPEAHQEVHQLDTVLSKLNELEGPKLARRQARSDTSRKEEGRAWDDRKKVNTRRDNAAAVTPAKPPLRPKREAWQSQKAALERKFGETGWAPRKRLSPDTLEGIRALHASDPGSYTTDTLSEHFKVTPEAIRRILKSKWKPNDDEMEDRKLRWERRGVKKWSEMAAQGVRPPGKWRGMGIGSANGLKEERVPRRKKRTPDSGELSWDEVVGDVQPERENYGGNLAERLL